MASPLQSFLMGQQAAQNLAEREQALNDQRAMSSRQETQFGQQQKQFTQQQTIQAAQVMSQFLNRVKQIPDVNQRLALFERARPELSQFGINIPPNIKAENVTDEGLIPLETGIGNLNQSLTPTQKDFGFISKEGRFTPDEKRDYALYLAGQRSRPTEAIALAQDQDLTSKVAQSKREIKTQEKLGEGEATAATEAIDKGFQSINSIQGNVRNIDRAISALDRGAKTGAIQQYLPSITAASRELDQIQKELGLDVVGSTTFGALSEGELRLALEVGLPQGLDEVQLKDYLLRKREAQQKLIGYYQDQIDFLDEGGTVPEWVRLQRRLSQKQAPQQDSQPQTQQPTGQTFTSSTGIQFTVE